MSECIKYIFSKSCYIYIYLPKYIWRIFEIYLAYIWNISGIYLKYIGHKLEIYLAYIWNISGIYLKYIWHIFEIYLTYIYDGKIYSVGEKVISVFRIEKYEKTKINFSPNPIFSFPKVRKQTQTNPKVVYIAYIFHFHGGSNTPPELLVIYRHKLYL